MGNEDKIKDTRLSKLKFLPQEFPHDESKALIYSLEDEFARTKKNRNILLYFIVIGFVSFLVFGTYLLTSQIAKEQKKTDIKITEFEDLKLKELLDTAKKTEKKLEKASGELKTIYDKMNKALENTKIKRYKKGIRKKFAKLIQAKKEEITSIEKERENYDLKLRDSVRKAEEMVNNYQTLVRLKMKAQKKYYRRQIWKTFLRYNPNYTSTPLKNIIRKRPIAEGAYTNSRYAEGGYAGYKKVLNQEKIITEDGYGKLQKTINNQNQLLSRMKKIPYRNSVRPTIRHLESNSQFMVKEYELMLSNFIHVVNKKNKLINNYKIAFNYLSQTKPESGYIIDPSNSESISVHINKLRKIKAGDIGLVFRKDDEFIAKIEFYFEGGTVRAKVLDLKKDKKIKPFDNILIKI